MKIRVLGIEKRHLDFENAQGQRVVMDGRQLHYCYPLRSSGSEGSGCDHVFISDQKFGAIDFKVGQVYQADTNRAGRFVDFDLLNDD